MWAYSFYDLLISYSIIVVSTMTIVYTRNRIEQSRTIYLHYHGDISMMVFYIKRLIFLSLYFRLFFLEAYMKVKSKARIHLVLVFNGIRTNFTHSTSIVWFCTRKVQV